MSAENVKAFIEKLNSDETFRSQIATAGSQEARLQMAKEAGFELSTEELSSIIDQFVDEELSEDELDAVAGGGENHDKWIDVLSRRGKVEEGKSIDKSSPLL